MDATCRRSIRCTGAFQIDDEVACATSQMERSGYLIRENIWLKRKEEGGTWSRQTVTLPILYRLYASSAFDAYVLAVGTTSRR